MSFSLKNFSIQIFVLFSLLVSTSVLACTSNTEFNGNINETIIATSLESKFENHAVSAPKKNKAHQHSQMSGDSNLEDKTSTQGNDCKCCEFGGCGTCVGCSGSCGTATLSISSSVEPANTPLGRFVQMQSIYASISPIPLERPPK